jgi:hypothetical protein
LADPLQLVRLGPLRRAAGQAAGRRQVAGAA